MRAVLDTSVLVAALRSRRGASFELLRRLRAGEWKLILSNTVLAEYEEVLKRESPAFWLSTNEIDHLLDALCQLAERRQLGEKWTPILVDPEDEAFARLAWETGADCLVTFNIRHFAPLRQLDIPVLTPGDFLSKLKTAP
ncbi:MAG TPA: putative toxin-antitoxin system toxin component, PIN family [Opitutales bacterium]|jgi:putative PIN family toxin of toxin-antitoxin system|nr:putative toxin-antitoxin system toxin component, PIN family [Opitutales bacterium]